MKPLPVEMACLLGVQVEIQAVCTRLNIQIFFVNILLKFLFLHKSEDTTSEYILLHYFIAFRSNKSCV